METITDFSTVIATLAFIGFLTETVVELIKGFLPGKLKVGVLNALAVVVAMVLVYALQISIFEASNKIAFYVGMIVCGLVASRGASYVHNWFDKYPKKD